MALDPKRRLQSARRRRENRAGGKRRGHRRVRATRVRATVVATRSRGAASGDASSSTRTTRASAGLVRRSTRWPGLTTAGVAFGTPLTFERPDQLFDRENPAKTDTPSFTVIRPAVLLELSDEEFQAEEAASIPYRRVVESVNRLAGPQPRLQAQRPGYSVAQGDFCTACLNLRSSASTCWTWDGSRGGWSLKRSTA